MTICEQVELVEKSLDAARKLRRKFQVYTSEYEAAMDIIICLQTLRLNLEGSAK
jgi:hypothetical protein